MDIFWFLFGVLAVGVALAVSGGKELVRGDSHIAAFKISVSVAVILLIGYLLYLDGLFYGYGTPLTIFKLFH